MLTHKKETEFENIKLTWRYDNEYNPQWIYCMYEVLWYEV